MALIKSNKINQSVSFLNSFQTRMSPFFQICRGALLFHGVVPSLALLIFQILIDTAQSVSVVFNLLLIISEIVVLIPLYPTENARRTLQILIGFTGLTKSIGIEFFFEFSLSVQVLFVFVCIAHIFYLRTYDEKKRELFLELIGKHPRREKPKDEPYRTLFLMIRESECCGIDGGEQMELLERRFFSRIGPNCFPSLKPKNGSVGSLR